VYAVSLSHERLDMGYRGNTLNHQNLSSFIWSVADLLRGDYKQSDYGKVILPFTVLRRLDCVLEPTKAKVLAEYAAKKKAGLNSDPFLLRASGQSFYNTSDMDLRKLMGDQDHISQNLYAYVQGFSPAVREIFDRFNFSTQIDKLAKSGLLYLITEKFAGIDLHPEVVDNHEMGLAFEELINIGYHWTNFADNEHVSAKPENFLSNVGVDSIYKRDYRNHGRNADYDAQKGQHRPQFIRPQRL